MRVVVEPEPGAESILSYLSRPTTCGPSSKLAQSSDPTTAFQRTLTLPSPSLILTLILTLTLTTAFQGTLGWSIDGVEYDTGTQSLSWPGCDASGTVCSSLYDPSMSVDGVASPVDGDRHYDLCLAPGSHILELHDRTGFGWSGAQIVYHFDGL